MTVAPSLMVRPVVNESRTDVMGEEEMERALREALRLEPLSSERLARIARAVEAEWRRGVRDRRARRARWWIAASAASLAVFALLSWWAPMGRAERELVGTIQSAGSSGLVATRAWGMNRALRGGAVLESGVVVRADGVGVVALEGGGLLRLKAGTVVKTGSRHEIELEQGALYVDLDANAPHGAWSIRTRYGVVQHLGTQFEVAVFDAGLRVRVREGYVRVLGRPDSDAQAGEEIVLADAGGVHRSAIAPDDPSWAWVQEPTSRFEVEGESVLALLRWVARETGRQLDFADAQTRQLAERTVLHGSVRGFSAEQALRVMLATTTLSADLHAGHIRVRSSSALPVVRAH